MQNQMEEITMNQKPWKDAKGNCKCESCGKTVPKNELYWERGLGYCKACHKEIQIYNQRKKS